MPTREVLAHVRHPASGLGHAPSRQLAFLVVDRVWHHSRSFVHSEVGMDHADRFWVDCARHFVEEEEILFLRRRGGDAVLCHQVAQVSQRCGESHCAVVYETTDHRQVN